MHLRDVSLFRWLRESNFEGKYAWKPRSKPLQRVINYYPKYSPARDSSEYEDNCRVKLMLHHPFVDPGELKVVDPFSGAFHFCQEFHSHPSDFYDDPVDPEAENDDTDSDYDGVKEEGDRDDEVGNDEMYARRGPLNDLSRIENLYSLGDRDIGRQYDRTRHVGCYDVEDKWMDEMKAQQRRRSTS